ncbi:MAG: hypothetical protein ACPLSJ_06155 [Thermosulfidibacteraceae bacterium]|jgi:hypothetical protein
MRGFTSIKDTLLKILEEKEELKKVSLALSIRKIWNDLPGEIPKIAKPISLKNRTLMVAVREDFPLSELKLKEKEIKAFLIDAGFDIDNIYFYYEEVK